MVKVIKPALFNFYSFSSHFIDIFKNPSSSPCNFNNRLDSITQEKYLNGIKNFTCRDGTEKKYPAKNLKLTIAFMQFA